MSKQVTLGGTARENLVKGIDILADAVVSTLGPNGRNVVIANDNGTPQSTKDGVTVAKSISLSNPEQELGVQLVKQAAIKTAEKAGDGTTTSTLLAREMVKAGLNALNNNENAVQIKRDIDSTVAKIVDNLRNNQIFHIYPNPASNELNIKIESNLLGSKFRIINSLGQEIKQGELRSLSSAIDVSKLPKGNYFIQIGTENYSHQFLVE